MCHLKAEVTSSFETVLPLEIWSPHTQGSSDPLYDKTMDRQEKHRLGPEEIGNQENGKFFKISAKVSSSWREKGRSQIVP